MIGVYFIRAGRKGPVKIGSLAGGNIYKRLATLQCGNHLPLYLRSFIVGNSFTENQLHLRFSHLRIRGEWFKMTGDLKEFLDWLPHPPIGAMVIDPAIPDPTATEKPAPYIFLRRGAQ
jgi:hypothetical protein